MAAVFLWLRWYGVEGRRAARMADFGAAGCGWVTYWLSWQRLAHPDHGRVLPLPAIGGGFR
jgi:hypothetical protein